MAATATTRRANLRGPATREKILRESEQLFAREGFDRVTLRQIARASGQGNVAAVQYHFGSKQGLLEAIIEEHQEAIEVRRRALLSEAEARNEAGDLDALLHILVDPLIECLGEPSGRAYLQIQAQVLAQSAIRPATRTVIEAISQHLGRRRADPHTERFAVILLFHALADRARIEEAKKSAVRDRASFAEALRNAVYGLQQGFQPDDAPPPA